MRCIEDADCVNLIEDFAKRSLDTSLDYKDILSRTRLEIFRQAYLRFGFTGGAKYLGINESTLHRGLKHLRPKIGSRQQLKGREVPDVGKPE